MYHRLRAMAAVLALGLAGTFILPPPADARGRRNYSEEWEREEREEERREERERARQEHLEHSKESQDRYYKHRERQLDRVIDHHDRHWGHAPAAGAPAPRKKSGTCIYGDGGKILYQPDGVVCNHQ